MNTTSRPVLSPYLPAWPGPWHHPLPVDTHGLLHGDMVLDDVTGKIFLVPQGFAQALPWRSTSLR
jgi:hypothetical protein